MTLVGSPLIKQLEEQFLTPEQGFSTSAVLTFGAWRFLGDGGCPVLRTAQCLAALTSTQLDANATPVMTTETVSGRGQMCPGRPRVENRYSRDLSTKSNHLLLKNLPSRQCWTQWPSPVEWSLRPSSPPLNWSPRSQKTLERCFLTATITGTVFFPGIYIVPHTFQRALHSIKGKNIKTFKTRRICYSLRWILVLKTKFKMILFQLLQTTNALKYIILSLRHVPQFEEYG